MGALLRLIIAQGALNCTERPLSARSALNPRRLGTALQRFCASQQRSDLTATCVVSPCMAIKADSLRVAVNLVGGTVDQRCSPSCIAL
jgi:hypothetical protein